MDRLWSPWRAGYVASGVDSKAGTCIFCEIGRRSEDDEKNFVVHRGQQCFVVLNLYPYTSGHLMVIPYEHVGDLAGALKEVTDEMMDLVKRAQRTLRTVYNPAGFNLGMNLGAAAGAGIVDHIHMHVMPRWGGDTNFMTTIAETRVISETLEVSYEKVRSNFE